jgi:hypothetical protein
LSCWSAGAAAGGWVGFGGDAAQAERAAVRGLGVPCSP